MQVEITDSGPCRKTLKITVPKEDVRQEIDEQYKQLMENAQVSGFRKGHAPRRLIERRFGEDIQEQTKEKLVMDAIAESLEDNKLKPLSDPDVKDVAFDPEADLTFEAELDVAPTFDIDGYKGIEVKRKSEEATDEEVDKEIERLRERTAELRDAPEGTSEKDDILYAEVSVEAEGESLWSQPAAAFEAGGERIGPFSVPGIAKDSIGKKTGDELELTFTLPDDFGKEELRGKEATVKAKVKDVKRPFYPEVNDDWAKQVGGNSLDDLKDRLRKNVEAMKKRDAELDVERQIEDALLKLTEVDIPDRLVKSETARVKAMRQIRLLQMGMPREELAERDELVSQGTEEAATRRCKLYFLLQKVADQERIFATEEEIETRIKETAARRGTTAAKLHSEMETSGEVATLRSEMREEKTMEFLKKHAKSD
jgi:trigger factor